MVGRGRLVVFEGIDGSGLTTQSRLLHRHLCEETQGRAHLTKEPTDGPVGAQLLLALRGRLVFEPAVMALCFAADRLDHLATEIVPRLQAGFYVVSDRYFLSSLAYQALDSDVPWLRAINSRCRQADLTFFLDVPVDICMARLRATRWRVELFETPAKLAQVRENYVALIKEAQGHGENVVVVPGVAGSEERSIEAVAKDVREEFARLISYDG